MEIAGVTVGGAAAILGYKFARPFFGAKVNCWFCNQDFKVDYKDRNNWKCPGCDQYNGPEDDEIEMVDSPKQKVRYCFNQKTTSEEIENQGNGLCQTCNLNQELKVHQLKSFVPKNPQKYDDEVQEYAKHLERTYRLCRYCEASLHQTLGQQDSWLKPKLLSWKLEKSRQSPLTSAINSSKINGLEAVDGESWMLFRIWTKHFILGAFTLLTFISCFVNMEIRYDVFDYVNSTLPEIMTLVNHHCKDVQLAHHFRKDVIVIMALICHLSCLIREKSSLSCWRGTKRGKFQNLGFVSWICLTLMTCLDEWTNFKVKEQVLLCLVTACFFLTWNIMIFNFPSRDQVRRFLKRNQSRSNREREDAKIDHEKLGNFGEWQWTKDEDVLSQDLVSTSTPTPSFFANPEPNNSSGTSNESDKGCDISSLTIKPGQSNGTLNNHWESMSNSAFSLRQYDPSGNDSAFLFSQQIVKPIVRPPKFFAKPASVAQSSWVAGGYWRPRNAMFAGSTSFPNFPSSRCSSQSSGFVSNNGKVSPSLAPRTASPKPSWEWDRASLFSEPARKTATRNSGISLGPLGDQLSFYDVSKVGPHRESSPIYESDEEEIKNETLLASGGFNPPVSSSPESRVELKPKSFWDKKIKIDISVYSLVFFLSVVVNIALLMYFGSRFVSFQLSIQHQNATA